MRSRRIFIAALLLGLIAFTALPRIPDAMEDRGNRPDALYLDRAGDWKPSRSPRLPRTP